MVDIERGSTAYGGNYKPKPGYDTTSNRWDLNRILNAVALTSVIVFWLWTAMYWILQYIPMPLSMSIPGSKKNDYRADNYYSEVADYLCPTDNDGAPIKYCVWYYPALICFTIVAALVRGSKKIHPNKSKWLRGDMDYILFSYVAIFLPLIIFFSFYMYKKWPSKEDDDGYTHADWVAEQAGTWANRIGFVGFWPLTFFMIPATRHGPLLSVLGWHPYHACTIHMFCGWMSYWCSLGHFVAYIIKYAVGTDYAYDEETKMARYNMIFPKPMCFTWNGIDGGQVNTTTGEPVLNEETGDPVPPLGYDSCDKALSGFYGTLAITFFTILVLCSMKYMRRYRYQVFYFAHIICAPLFLLLVSTHWSLTYMYFWPSLFYYFATQAPFLLQHSRNTINNYGMKITGVMDIPCRQSPKNTKGDNPCEHQQPSQEQQRSLLQRIFSPDAMDWLDEELNRRGPQAKSIEHCVSFDFAVTDEGFQQFYPGMYGNIWCPDSSMKSHPFSITHVPGSQNQLRIIFRVFGKWTDLLARSLIQLPCPGHQQEFLPIPKIMMDGWHGPNHLVGSAFNHEKATIVTAGIGITAFLSMFTELIELLCFQENGMFIHMHDIQGTPLTKEFVLHWTCRDENLIKYITDEYFQPLLEKANRIGGNDDGYTGVRCHIHIHRTGPAGKKTISPNSLWMSFRDKTERGVTEIEFGLLGTFGTPWSPYRFSFGRHDTFWNCIPSIVMFCAILWTSYLFTLQVHIWLRSNAFELPDALIMALRMCDFIPTLFCSFVLGWIGHILVDWTENIYAKQKSRSDYMIKNTHKTMEALDIDEQMQDDDGDELATTAAPGKGPAEEHDCRGDCLPADHENNNTKEKQLIVPVKTTAATKCQHESKMISLHSTAGRPDFRELVEVDQGQDNQYESTGIYLCGPEAMISSCKKAAGMTCQIAAGRIQMCAKKNQFVFYEEKFEWS